MKKPIYMTKIFWKLCLFAFTIMLYNNSESFSFVWFLTIMASTIAGLWILYDYDRLERIAAEYTIDEP